MGSARAERGPDAAPGTSGAESPLPLSQAFPAKLESPHPKASRDSQHWLGQRSWKAHQGGTVLPLASGA